jgi:RecA-family ATPase
MPFPPASRLNPPAIEWLWPGYLSGGSLAILDGDPGLGKSLVTLDLAARLSTARPWPDGAATLNPAGTLLLCAEDSDAVLIARLNALGANLDRIYLWPRHAAAGMPRLPSDVKRLDKAVAETSAKLVVIDPIVAFLDRSAPMNSDAAIRRALHPLVRLAERRRCAVLLVRHLRKENGAHALYRGGGSIGFIAACRLAWLAGRDERQDRLVLAQSKNNYAPPQPSLAYSLTPPATDQHAALTRPDDARAATLAPLLTWHGPSPWTADELSARRVRPSRRRARDFLRTFLAPGPRLARDLWSAASQHDFSAATLRRAKKELNIRCQPLTTPSGRRDYWLLPGQELPTTPSATSDLDNWLRRLDEQYPPKSPLDGADEDAA